jgi:glycosyltransferase involved in cell wall biosynthesis
MNLLLLHNYYQRSGGEDAVFASEAALLRQYGHSVTEFEQHNSAIRSGGVAAFLAIWNPKTHRQIRTLAPSAVAHFHNTFPLVSPSAYYAARHQGAAVVQTLHNFRLICPGALLTRNGVPCEECIAERSLRPSITHACYRNSRAATASVAAMLSTHRAAGTYQHAVDAYIALSEFSRSKFIAGGLPAERIMVKPNFVFPAPQTGAGSGNYALFVGRLSQEKGIETLATAWNTLPDIPLTVVGAGPLTQTTWLFGISALGHQPHHEVIRLIRDARVLIFPSTWYECAPMTVLEAFACGTPVIASDLGSMAELVRDGHTGLLFRPGDPADLAEKVRYAFSHPEHLAQMRINARREFEEKYTAERNYKMLISIYEQAIENARRRKPLAS